VKSLELQAVVSLARLWQEQDRRAEARQRLTKIYNGFIEGFGTVGLKEAKMLLEALASPGHEYPGYTTAPA
jgi:adenylate cyclase